MSVLIQPRRPQIGREIISAVTAVVFASYVQLFGVDDVEVDDVDDTI